MGRGRSCLQRFELRLQPDRPGRLLLLAHSLLGGWRFVELGVDREGAWLQWAKHGPLDLVLRGWLLTSRLLAELLGGSFLVVALVLCSSSP